MEDLERVKEVIKACGLTIDQIAIETKIGSTRWRNIKDGKVKIRVEDIQALAGICPEYGYWLAYGLEIPEAGQISPMTKIAQEKLNQA